MRNLTFENITKACEGKYIGDESLFQTQITGAVIDSRLVKEGYLFIPVKGEKVDGHKFIPNVFEQGAAIVLSEHELENPAGPYVLVDSTTDAMKKLAAFYRKGLDIKVVGITKKRFETGNISVTELNTAIQELETAKSQYISQLQTYWSYYYTLRKYTLYDWDKHQDLTVDFDKLVQTNGK